MISRRHVLGGIVMAAGCAAAGAQRASAEPVFTPESFGATGDGRTDDSLAFQRLGDQVSRAGGGTIVLRPTVYRVGRQTRGPSADGVSSFEPVRLLEIRDCSRPVIIQGNGATMRCTDGLRYGTFDVRSGRATRHKTPFLGLGELASPYRYMIRVERCRGLVEVADLELDGNLPRLAIGGPWGDTGYQLAAYGLALVDNSGAELVRNVHTHHHALDGLYLDAVDRDRGNRTRIENVRSEYNGRQGASVVGGRGYDFIDCRFDHQGRGGLASAPGAGLDIEAERGKRVRDLTFLRCRFADNHGVGMVADSGNSEGARFTHCTFIGTTEWAAWPNKPGFVFDRCTFVGPVVRAWGDKQSPSRATRFVDCRFFDDPALSPTNRIFGGTNPERPIADFPVNPNVRFQRCFVRLTHQAVLPWTTDVIYEDCTMSQRSPVRGYPRGHFVGRNVIDGNVDLSFSRNSGVLIVNGEARPRNA